MEEIIFKEELKLYSNIALMLHLISQILKNIHGISYFIQCRRTPQDAWNGYTYENLFGKQGDHKTDETNGNI